MIKFFTKVVSAAILVGSVVVLTGCPGDSGGTDPMKVQLGKLSKQWSIVSAELNTQDRTAAFTDFTLTISGTFNKSTPEGPYNYSVNGSMQDPSPWPASGTWKFNSVDGSNTGSMVRFDGVPMSYVINSNGQLELTLTCSDCNYPGARIATVQGNWVFVMQ